jgi:hypothetical protein
VSRYIYISEEYYGSEGVVVLVVGEVDNVLKLQEKYEFLVKLVVCKYFIQNTYHHARYSMVFAHRVYFKLRGYILWTKIT